MKITPSRINTLLTIGEDLNIEFKRAGDGPKADTFESVCAFLNKAGGDLLLGVDDDFVMVMPRPQSSVKSSIRSSVKSVDKSVDWSVDKSVDWTCDHVLSILKTNPRATLDQVANVVGLSVRGVEQAIKRLKKAKRIRKVGGKRFVHWEVIG